MTNGIEWTGPMCMVSSGYTWLLRSQGRKLHTLCLGHEKVPYTTVWWLGLEFSPYSLVDKEASEPHHSGLVSVLFSLQLLIINTETRLPRMATLNLTQNIFKRYKEP